MQWTINTQAENATHTSGLIVSFKSRVFMNISNTPKDMSSWEIDRLTNEVKEIYINNLDNNSGIPSLYAA
jgi:hypothetical protein